MKRIPVNCLETRLAGVPTHIWRDDNVNARAIAVAMHGLMMHGKKFDSLACKLARRGLIVVAPDLRGFGQWQFNSAAEETRVDYRKSVHDLLEVFSSLVRDFGDLPLIGIGESLGAHLARILATTRPEMFSGLILSSP